MVWTHHTWKCPLVPRSPSWLVCAWGNIYVCERNHKLNSIAIINLLSPSVCLYKDSVHNKEGREDNYGPETATALTLWGQSPWKSTWGLCRCSAARGGQCKVPNQISQCETMPVCAGCAGSQMVVWQQAAPTCSGSVGISWPLGVWAGMCSEQVFSYRHISHAGMCY